MIPSNAQDQDEAILSERNEREQFQSRSSSDSNESNEELDEEEEQLQPKDQSSTFQENQGIKEDTKKKDIKETFFQKIKAYLGFGDSDLIANQKIGFFFIFPISSNWSFKLQVTIAQIIIASASLLLFTGIQHIGQTSLIDSTKNWTKNNSYQLISTQVFEVAIGFFEQLIINSKNDEYIMNLSIDFLISPPITYYGDLLRMDDALPDATNLYLPKNGIIDSYTYNFATFTTLTDCQLSITEIRNYMSFNNVLYYDYQMMGSYLVFILDNGLIIQYPGINVTNLTAYNEYRYQQYIEKIDVEDPPNEYALDSTLGTYVYRQVFPINDENSRRIGIAFCERTPAENYIRFIQITQNCLLNSTLFYLSQTLDILYYQKAEYDINITDLSVELQKIYQNETRFHKLNNTQYLDLYQSQQPFNETQSQFIVEHFQIYFGQLNDQDIFLTIFNNSGYYMAILYPYYLIEEMASLQNDAFYEKLYKFKTQLLPIAIAIPLIHIFFSIIYLVREIKPLKKITEFADQLLKKSQKFDEKQIDDQEGGGLIQQLTSILRKLMVNLNKSKLLKKQEIIEFYNNQTYPKNNKSRDVTPILEEIQKIREDLINKDPGLIQFPNLDD